MPQPLDILKRYFGYDDFRANQAQIVDAILGGRDVLAIMPTGAGKSGCGDAAVRRARTLGRP